MAIQTVVENDLLHVMTWTLAHLETLCKELVSEGEEIWPTMSQLVTSGQLGKDIINILATLKPVIVYAQSTFPQYASLLTWAIDIITDIANFDAVNIPCSCPACA
jgi:hypothetical protein